MDKKLKLTSKRTLLSMLVASAMLYGGVAQAEAERICELNGSPIVAGCGKGGSGNYSGAKTAETGIPSGTGYSTSLSDYDNTSYAALTTNKYNHQAAVSGSWLMASAYNKRYVTSYSKADLKDNTTQISNSDIRIGGVSGAITLISGLTVYAVFAPITATVSNNQSIITDSTLDVKAQDGTIAPGAKSYNISGAFNYWTPGAAVEKFSLTANDNKVTIDHSTITSALHNGVVGYYGDLAAFIVNNNKVEFTGANNGVTIKNGSTINTSVMGIGGSINSNGVKDLGASSKCGTANLYTCYAQTVTADDNKNIQVELTIDKSFVDIDSSTVNGDIVGGYGDLNGVKGTSSADIKLTNTTIDVVDSNITGNIYGSKFVALGDTYKNTTAVVSGNEITIKGGEYTNTSIYGAYLELEDVANIENSNFTANNNSITIRGDQSKSKFDGLYGGYLNGKYITDASNGISLMKGNSLNIESTPVKAGEVGNFESYTFKINDENAYIANGKEALLTADTIKNAANSAVTSAVIKNFTYGSIDLTKDNYYKLIRITDGDMSEFDNASVLESNDEVSVNVGFTGSVTVDYKFDDDGDLIAYVEAQDDNGNGEEGGNGGGEGGGSGGGSGGGNGDREDLDVLDNFTLGRLAQLMQVTQAGDLLANDIWMRIKPMEHGQVAPLILVQQSHNKYKPNGGSDVKADFTSIIAGVSYQDHDWTLGIFAEYGTGNWKADGEYSIGNVHAKGDHYYIGAGMLARYTMDNGLYFDGSVHAGKSHMDFESSDMNNHYGLNSSYDLNDFYMGGHLGAGYEYLYNPSNTFISSVKWLYTFLDKDDGIKVDGSPMTFHAARSSRAQLSETWLHQFNSSAALKLGAAFEYEFLGSAPARLENLYLNNTRVRGSTGVGTLGLVLTPFENNDPNKFIELDVKGYGGKREGISGVIYAKYTF